MVLNSDIKWFCCHFLKLSFELLKYYVYRTLNKKMTGLYYAYTRRMPCIEKFRTKR